MGTPVGSILFAVLAVSILGCTSSTSGEAGGDLDANAPVVIDMPYTKTNLQVPRVLWKQMKEILEKDGVSEEVRNNFAIYPTKVSVDLVGQNKNVLKDNQDYKIQFPEGGGDLDLFEYVSGKGDFFIRLGPELMNDSPFHVLYLSDSPGRVVGEAKWGNGCHRIFDLSAKADALIGGSGLLATTGRKHYLHLLAGVYVIFQMVEDRMLLGYIRVLDSRYPQFTCSS